MKPVHLYTCTALILAALAYLIWRGAPDYSGVENAVRQHMERADRLDARFDSLLSLVPAIDSALARNEVKRITNHNHYVTEISEVMAADSGAQYRLYVRNIARFDSLFAAGYFFEGHHP